MANDNTVDSIKLVLDAASEQWRRELKRAEDATEKLRKKTDTELTSINATMGKLDAAAGKLGKAFIGLAAGVSVAGLAAFVRKTSEMADSLQTAADRAGLNVEVLQQLQFAAKRTDVDVGALQSSFERFTKRLGEAQAGGGEFLKIAKEYGLALRDNNGTARNAEAVFGDLADAVAGATSHQEKMRIATQAFGKEGGQLVLLLQHGRQGIEKFGAQARELGLVLGADGVGRLATFNDTIDILGERASAASTNLVITLLPALEAAVGLFGDATRGAADLIAQFTALENRSLAQLEKRAETLRSKLKITEQTNSLDLFGFNSDMRKELEEIEARIAQIRAGLAAPTSAPLGTTPERVVELSDNLATLNAELVNARKALDVLKTGGSDAFAEFVKLAEIEQKAAAAADAFNRSNKGLIESGQVQARTAASYLDVLAETAKLQEEATDRTKLDAYVEKLVEQYGVAKDRLLLGEAEAKVTAEINKLREQGIELSADEIAVIRKTIGETERLNDQWKAQEKAVQDAAKAAADFGACAEEFPADFADEFNAALLEILS